MKVAPVFLCLVLTSLFAIGQDQPDSDQATVETSIAPDGTGSIIVEARGKRPDPPLLFNTEASSSVIVSSQKVATEISLKVNVLQGKAKTLSYHLRGPHKVTGVSSKSMESWSVRETPKRDRYLDIKLKHPASENPELAFKITLLEDNLELPSTLSITHLAPEKPETAGFSQIVQVNYKDGLSGQIKEVSGFIALNTENDQPNRFQSTTGGRILIDLKHGHATPPPVELTNARLQGIVAPDGKSISFTLNATATVTEPEGALHLLSGSAAASRLPGNRNYQLHLRPLAKGASAYDLVFTRSGTYPVQFDFVAPITQDKEWKRVSFNMASGAVTPVALEGLNEIEFRHDTSVVPEKSNEDGGTWNGFIPASGSLQLIWKDQRKIGEGKLFYSTTARVEATVSAGLLRQTHHIDYQILQGELESLSLAIDGPGEILDVSGSNVVGWAVDQQGDYRCLEVRLSKAIKESGNLQIRTQLPLDAFPVTVESLRLTPRGAVRHSGFLRLSNEGSVRLEPTGLSGLTQLSPNQFPDKEITARQVFVYRFPSAQRHLEVVADRIQPEVNLSELVIYQLAETDRLINGDIELDIREAPIREWDILIPADYSVVSATGANVADYIVATDTTDAQRNLKIIFNADVQGRQLVTLQLEKNEPATAGAWLLPKLSYPDAESVRGDIGIVGAPGFRIAVSETELLVEKPLSYFPKPVPNLQQAFRIREEGWSATMDIELLEKSVQADLFHLYSLSEGTAYGSVLANYFISGAPVSELEFTVPQDLGNVAVEGMDVRTFRQVEDTLIVSLHQPVMGPYTVLITFEEKLSSDEGQLRPGRIVPLDVQGERGFLQVVSPMQVDTQMTEASENLLELDALELPAEFRLLSAAPSLGSWQYTERPFELALNVNWFDPGNTVTQVVEFSEVTTRVSPDGELVTDLLYYVKSRGQRALKVQLPESTLLWAVSVAGKSVTARQADEATLIPLPGATDPNIPIEVRLRLGRPVVEGRTPHLVLPIVEAPVLKTEWKIHGDENHLLIPAQATVAPPVPVLRPTGFDWITRNAIGSLLWIALLTAIGAKLTTRRKLWRVLGLLFLLAAVFTSIAAAASAARSTGPPHPLQLSLPLLTAGETVELTVKSLPLWKANLIWPGLIAVAVGAIGLIISMIKTTSTSLSRARAAFLLLIMIGLLIQRDGAPLFFGASALAIAALLLLPRFTQWLKEIRNHLKNRPARDKTPPNLPETDSGTATASLIIGALFLLGGGISLAQEPLPGGYLPFAEVDQKWELNSEERRIQGNGTIRLSGSDGDSFLLLKSPAVLTEIEGESLHITRQTLPNIGLCYLVTIQEETTANAPVDPFAPDADRPESARRDYTANFTFQFELGDLGKGFSLPTGPAAVQKIRATFDKAGWEFVSPTAVKITPVDRKDKTEARLLLSPHKNAHISLRAKARDASTEETQFFVEASNLYLPSPGVVDGIHRISVRPAQGEVKALSLTIPQGLTVSEVTGPVTSWQFDADTGALQLSLEPAQSGPFDLSIHTQRGLDPLPTEVELSPLRIKEAAGEVGLVALAFGPDAQPEKVESNTLSAVNLSDFDASLLPNEQSVLHRVYRYGADGGSLALRIAPVSPEIRVTSTQVLSLGDERVVLSVNFNADITRAGLFQLSFPLPEGLEVESLSGGALDHWSELTVDDERQIILHLNGKTMGQQNFALALTGSAPQGAGEWKIPRFELNEATRQTGELVVQPTTGIRLQTLNRQNISEIDPRTLGGESKGALAYRLLQRDWELNLGVEILDPWITGQVLHEITLREGQTRTSLFAQFNVTNASIRSLPVRIPTNSESEIKAIRASGSAVSDLIRTGPDSDLWEIQFKRRVVGKVDVRIEFEHRGERANDSESLTPLEFPDSRQLSYYFAIRAGGRLELEAGEMPSGWQHADWNTVPQPLRDSGNRNAPALTLRTISPEAPLTIFARRHSLADALKLRVAEGALTTVLSPVGDQLTAVDLTMEVIQRSSLTVQLPPGGELFSIFVNGESVYSVRKGDAWQFYILPGSDDHTAKVWFAYSVPGDRLKKIDLSSPQLNVPLENIEWNVLAPKGFELTDSSGNLELKEQLHLSQFDRSSYLNKAKGQREKQAQQAAQLLETANTLLQSGDQSKARWAFNSVANQYALDAASNEDARVQLENLQTQQAIVGLNTRRQRLVLDNFEEDVPQNEQLKQGADANRILNQGDLNYRPQELSIILQGNTSEDNAVLQRIASQLVKHQRTSVPAPQAITITLPEGGTAYSFNRTVQVSENAPLELNLKFASTHRMLPLKSLFVLLLLISLAGMVAFTPKRQEA